MILPLCTTFIHFSRRVSHALFLINLLIKSRPLGYDSLSTGTSTPPHQNTHSPFPSQPLKAETHNLHWDFSAGGLSGAELLITFPCPAAEEMRAFWCFSA